MPVGALFAPPNDVGAPIGVAALTPDGVAVPFMSPLVPKIMG